MSDNRIPTYIWVEAKIRDSHNNGKPIFVVNKGNRTGGMVLVKLNDLRGNCRLLMQQRNLDGDLEWIAPVEDGADEAAIDDYIRKELEFDTDLWVLEVEDPDMKNPFEEKG